MKTAFIAAGGTGGHIYPALALADAIKKIRPDIQIHFVGTLMGLEKKIITQYPLHFLSIGRLNSNVSRSERVLTLLKLPLSLIQSCWLILRYRPLFVLGVGGHASGPLLLMSRILFCETMIWEPNAVAGLANRILSRFVKRRFVVFPHALPKAQTVGLPVSDPIDALHKTNYSPHAPLRILVFGGSQGAAALNTVVAQTFCQTQWQGKITVVHQTGPHDFERVQKIYGEAPSWIEVVPYLYDMDKRYAHADLVVARSGTGTLFELAAAKKPAILIPLPTAADDHQIKNAEAFLKKGAAVMIAQKNFSPEILEITVESLIKNPSKLESMSKEAAQFYIPEAAQQLAHFLFDFDQSTSSL